MSASLSVGAAMGVGVDGVGAAVGVGGAGAAVGEGMGVAVDVGVTVGVGDVGAAVETWLIVAREGSGASGSIPQAASEVSAANAATTAANVHIAPRIPIRMMPFRPPRAAL